MGTPSTAESTPEPSSAEEVAPGQLSADQERAMHLEIRAEQLSVDSLVVLPRHLGQRPDNAINIAAWDRAAARIEQHRVAFAVTNERDPLGPAPGSSGPPTPPGIWPGASA